MPLARQEAQALLRGWLNRGMLFFLSASKPGSGVPPDFSPQWFVDATNATVQGSRLVYLHEQGFGEVGEMNQAFANGTGRFLVAATQSNRLLCWGELQSPIRCVAGTYILLLSGTVLIDFGG